MPVDVPIVGDPPVDWPTVLCWIERIRALRI
jgi:hypothetical protein